MKFEIFMRGKEKRVRFPECGDESCIEKMNGYEYFYVPNLLASNGKETHYLFCDCIADAITTIRNGDGDALSTSNLFGIKGIGNEQVIKFLDEAYGAEIRAKTIDGWKNAKFGHGIKIFSRNSFSSGNLVNVEYNVDPKVKPLFFETKETAEAALNEIIEISKGYAQEYAKKKSKTDKSNFLYNIFDERGLYSVYSRLLDKFIDEFANEENPLDICVVQIVK